ncbi:putative phage tail sheath protein [Candidatus Desulfarcum epimagneticum]|uniref:Putative phage tail sheath protein n=1 Tax=uncultured Desulfobacteraceae bacterium TaxID=218296 RepID=A0A484HIP3_9BACT|nr:putative phage tail sheath protein [uncultured Desulfobacteraceae bacterium]
MADYKTPGVYVEEKSTLAPSVATVATAIPAFIGYTETVPDVCRDKDGVVLADPVPVRISGMLEYAARFGGPPPAEFKVKMVGGEIASVTPPELKLYMHYSLSMYFNNGGGPCYIVSVGQYEQKMDKDHFKKGLAALEKLDEPTLILLTDSAGLAAPDYYELCQGSLAQCASLQDRFAIFDVKDNDADAFRDSIGINDLKYGAAYYPYLKTSLNFEYDENDVTVSGLDDFKDTTAEYETNKNGIRVYYTDLTGGDAIKGKSVVIEENTSGSGDSVTTFEVADAKLTIKLPKKGVSDKKASDTVKNILTEWAKVADKKKFNIQRAGTGTVKVEDGGSKALAPAEASDGSFKLRDLKYDSTSVYNNILTRLDGERVTMPPSPAIAGLYAKVDRDRGVWKAPANYSLGSVMEPTIKINGQMQENLNIDATAGKSINAIRTFTGKGNLVWGARTLAGNDNEWRYVSVRRLFNYIEESVQKSTGFAVFEPNTPMTWLKVKTMISVFLENLWREGALAGTSAEQAFFVKVGLNETMTEQDILEGRMNVEIGIAAVRPAEFIIMKFSHKLQNA